MRRLRRDLWRQIAHSVSDPRSAWSNARFLLGMTIGGFSAATRAAQRRR